MDWLMMVDDGNSHTSAEEEKCLMSMQACVLHFVNWLILENSWRGGEIADNLQKQNMSDGGKFCVARTNEFYLKIISHSKTKKVNSM